MTLPRSQRAFRQRPALDLFRKYRNQKATGNNGVSCDCPGTLWKEYRKSPPSRSPVREAAWQAARRSLPAQGRRLRPRSEDWCKRLRLAVAMGLQTPGMVVMGRLQPSSTRRDLLRRLVQTMGQRAFIARASFKRVRACRTRPRQGMWHTGISSSMHGEKWHWSLAGQRE
jgi:hypothetical protein